MGYPSLRNFITSDHEAVVIMFQTCTHLRPYIAQLVYYFVGGIECNRLLLFNYSPAVMMLLMRVLLLRGAALFPLCPPFVLLEGGGKNAGAYMSVIGSPTGLHKKFSFSIYNE